MKQHSAAIDNVGKLFYLSEGEKQFLLACDVGEGLFFAGSNHVAMRAMASPQEHQLVTSKPQEILEQKKAQAAPAVTPTPPSPTLPPPLTAAPATPFSQPATPAAPRPMATLPPRFKSEIIMENAQPTQPKPSS
jgi:hypothetical protein